MCAYCLLCRRRRWRLLRSLWAASLPTVCRPQPAFRLALTVTTMSVGRISYFGDGWRTRRKHGRENLAGGCSRVQMPRKLRAINSQFANIHVFAATHLNVPLTTKRR